MTALQRTMEWHEQRLGKPTASRFGDIKPGKGTKWSQTTLTYMRELLAERLTGQWTERYGAGIEWGNDHEDEARELYEQITGRTVERVGFAERDGMGGSPDGLIHVDGMLEIKCPINSGNHIDYILDGCEEHMPQIQANLYFTDRKWCDFCSYDPRMPEGMRLHIIHIERDDNYIVDLIAMAHEFAADLDEMERRVKGGMR